MNLSGQAHNKRMQWIKWTLRAHFAADLSVTGIPQSTISAIENDRVNLGVERAKQLAIALKCRPAVLVYPGWDIRHDNAA